MKKWEYKKISANESGGLFQRRALSEEDLNALGREGWELVAVSGYESPDTYLFKRELA